MHTTIKNKTDRQTNAIAIFSCKVRKGWKQRHQIPCNNIQQEMLTEEGDRQTDGQPEQSSYNSHTIVNQLVDLCHFHFRTNKLQTKNASILEHTKNNAAVLPI